MTKLTDIPIWKRRGVFAQLTESDQAAVVARANNACHLCGRLLDLNGPDVAADHIDPAGKIVASNIYLAHGRCNSFRRDLDVHVARKLVRFWRFLEDHVDLTLDEVLDEYVTGQRKRALKVRLDEPAGKVILELEEAKIGPLTYFIDPTTKWKFFYVDIPVNYICNDSEEDVQPRSIKFSHVQKLLKDFLKHPVHEPPACRLVQEDGLFRLRMFDGQHKTAAQLALERKVIHIKVYVEPPVDEIKSLVKSVQSTITKLPLSPGAFSKKMSKVHREEWEKFLEETTGVVSEKAFLARFKTAESKKAATQDLLEAHIAEAWHPEEAEPSRLASYVEPDNPDSGVRYPLKQQAFKSKLVKPLIWDQPLDKDDPEQSLRTTEGQNVRRFFNIVADVVLSNCWVSSKETAESPEHKASARFFQQGAMIGWVDLLRKVIVNVCGADPDEKERALLREITDQQWQNIHKAVERVYAHPLWSEADEQVSTGINLNKISATQALFDAKGLTFAYALGA